MRSHKIRLKFFSLLRSCRAAKRRFISQMRRLWIDGYLFDGPRIRGSGPGPAVWFHRREMAFQRCRPGDHGRFRRRRLFLSSCSLGLRPDGIPWPIPARRPGPRDRNRRRAPAAQEPVPVHGRRHDGPHLPDGGSDPGPTCKTRNGNPVGHSCTTVGARKPSAQPKTAT